MTREEKIAAIISAIQDDAKLIKVLRIAVSNNIINVEDAKLDAILAALGG